MFKKLAQFALLFGVLLSAYCGFAQKQVTTSFFFETDASKLSTRQILIFEQFVKEIVPEEVINVDILGYCDDRGREGYNNTLSLKRAEFIHRLLVEKGVLSERIKKISGKGIIPAQHTKEAQLLDEERSNNRRVDVVINYHKPIVQTVPPLLNDSLKIGDKIVLDNILFENSRSVLIQESIPLLEQIATLVKEKKQYQIAILGHICCNPPGVDVIDLETGQRNLSEARARLIYDYFIYRGIDKNRLSYKGMMANYPLGKGDKYDRRVELLITGINKE